MNNPAKACIYHTLSNAVCISLLILETKLNPKMTTTAKRFIVES